MKLHKPVHKWIGIAALVVLIAAVVALWYVTTVEQRVKRADIPVIDSAEEPITDFASCVVAGNPVMESYPEQCSANGQTYVAPTDSGFTIDQNLLPEGWFVSESGGGSNQQATFNDGIGVNDSQPTCNLDALFVEINANEATPITDTSLLDDYKKQLQDDKGYSTTIDKDVDYQIKLNGLVQDVKFYETTSTIDSETATIISTVAFIIVKREYAIIKLACTNGDFDDKQAVMQAVAVEVY